MKSSVDRATLVEIHSLMYRIRLFETALAEVFEEMRSNATLALGDRTLAFDANYGNGDVKILQGNLELAIGQEPTAAGVLHLRRDDYLASTHRSHHLALAKGVTMKRLLAEIYGKKTGMSRGKGGDLTLHDVTVNFETSGMMGQLLPVAVGHALAAKLKKTDRVAVVCVGEGSANQGTFHESANLAGVWNLPVIFVVEDNGWALSVAKEKSTSVEHHSTRAASYGFPGHLVEANDPVRMYEVMGECVERARTGAGPSLVEIQTDRLRGGFEGDEQLYRSREELELLRQRDALEGFQRQLVEDGAVTQDALSDLEGRIRSEIDEAFEFARSSDFPDPSEAFEHVFI